MAFGLAAVFVLFGSDLIAVMTTSETVREEAALYLIWAFLTPIAGVLAFQMDGIYVGATWSRDMRNMMIISVFTYLIVWAIATPMWGNNGLWFALICFLGVRGLTLLRKLPGNIGRTFPD